MAVSVIIPLFNKAPYIRRALESVLSQTVADLEVIVVNDGSTDDSMEQVRQNADERLKIIEQANAGPGAARNHGLSLARGDFIAFLDADDYWLPNFLTHNLALMTRYGSATTVASAYSIDTPDHSMGPYWQSRGLAEQLYALTPQTPVRIIQALLQYMYPGNMLIRSDFLRQLGGYYAKNRCLYGEDTYLELQLLFMGQTAISLTPVVLYDTRASELSSGSRAMHPLEPFLSDPGELFIHCPPHLHDLLRRVLAVLAANTAEEYAYWGQLRAGRALLRAFSHPSIRWTPRTIRAYLVTSPLIHRLRMLKKQWLRQPFLFVPL